ncbi:type VI secretion system Vgr family protein [Massilia sp. H6]|uniref:type VI secretion system Vgr family protein n=1 Tax=Massilia sp. H6 TaxID=2970464 RepID=UPI00216974F6|nr:type VI secretion system Vgr family protein [Massilia sp. H6]UVW28777.1 type VI secretion system tip protein VgrG [Massilia sp. H6]
MADMRTVQDLRLAMSTLGTRDRPLGLVLARADGARDDDLLAQRLIGKESVCGGFEYRVLCVADNAALALKDFIGLAAELRVITDRGNVRRICGIVTEAASGQSDGALATYQLVMRDALSIMEGRTNTRVFRNQNELDVIKTLVAEWHKRNAVLRATFELQVDVGLGSKFAAREFIMQHNESDAAFIRRLLQRRGIAWFFRTGLPNDSYQRRPRQEPIGHTLFLFENTNHLEQNAAGSVRFHRDAATEQRDGITGWSAVRTLQPGSVSLHTWDYKNPSGGMFMETRAQSRADQGERGNELAAGLDNYHVAAPHIAENARDLTELSYAQIAHYEYEAKSFHGEGGVRDLAVGEWFSLEGHPEINTHPANEREFVITAQHIAAQNNLPVEIGARVERLFNRNDWSQGDYAVFANGDGEPIRYKTRFTCVRRGIRIVPPRATLPQPALQTAIVVGPANEQVWCDEMGRVKIRFPATRPQDHEHANGVGSSDSDADSAWVRVASNWAGNGPGSAGQCGTRLLPPIGTEVLVGWAGADPDKPIIIGQLYNGSGPPPTFRHEGRLPGTKYQSGIRSREIRGGRGNQLRLDDTTGQISAQLASDHATTELNLGYLTELRQDGSAAPRGEGAELRSDEAIALHAARGILLSAWKLLGGANAKGSQLAREDYLGLLRECGELCAALGNFAAEHHGMPIDTKEQDELLARFKRWEGGSNTAPTAAEPGEPVIGITSPAGIGFASSKAIVSYSARNIDTVAQQHLQMTAGQRLSMNAGKGISLFAQNGGLTGIAHFGKLLLQSQHDDTDINSAKNLNVSATEGTVTVSGKVILLVAEDGSFLKLGDGPPVLGSKQSLKFHAPEFFYEGPESMTAQFPKFGEGVADQKLAVHYARGTPLENGDRPLGGAVKDARMNIGLSDGSAMQVRSGADGKSELIERDAMHMADISLMRGGDQ